VKDQSTAAGRRYRQSSRRWQAVGLPILGLACGIALWWLTVLVFDIQPFLLPTPGAVAQAFAQEPVILLEGTWITFQETVVGFLIAVVAGLAIGLAMASSRVVEQMLSSILVAFNAIPKLALAPLFVVWFGFDLTPKIVMVVVLCFFPIVLAVATGLKSTPAELAELARSLDASHWQMFRKVRFPAALGQIFVGLKVAMPLAVIGAVVGEFLGGTGGLGYVINSFSGVGDVAVSFAAIVLLAVISLVLFYAIVGVERLMVPWTRDAGS
jgi:NitT/TauT family transport system permease protein